MQKYKRLIIEGSILLFILLILGFFVYRPKLREYWANKAELSATEKDLAISQKGRSEFVAFCQEFNKHKEKLKKLTKKLPTEQEIPLVIDRIIQEANQRHLKMPSIEPKETIKTKSPYKQKPIEINLQGTYQNIASFLSNLNSLPWTLNTTKFQIMSMGGEPDPDTRKMTLQVTLNILTYTKPEETSKNP